MYSGQAASNSSKLRSGLEKSVKRKVGDIKTRRAGLAPCQTLPQRKYIKSAQAFLFCLARGKKDTLNSTLNWLNTHELLYDEVHLENDKSILFENSYAVIDDSPALLEKAERLGKVRTGLVHPWNRTSGQPVFDNLEEIYRYIKEWI